MPDFGIGEGLAALFSSGLFGAAEGAGAIGATEAGLGASAGIGALEGAGAATGAEALGGAAAGGLDAFAAGGLGDLAAAGGGAGDFGAGFGGAGAATGDLGAAIPNALAAPAGGGGLGAGAFAPAPGVELAGGIAPDATSAAAFNPGIDTFASRADAVSGAIQGGALDPQGANSTLFSGAGGPSGSPPPGGLTPDGGLPVQQVPTQSFTQSGTAGLDQQILNTQTGAGPPQNLLSPQATPGAATGVAPGSTSAAPATASPGFLDQVGNSIMKNPVGLGLGAAGLGYTVLAGQQQSAATKALADAAAKRGSTADTLSGYLTSGTLPPGLQAGADQAIASAKATAISNAAQQGLPTDPTQNTALAQRLAQIDQQGPIVAAQIAQNLLQSGATFAGLSDQLYTQLAQIDQQQTQAIGKSIAAMAAALNTGGTKIQIGGSGP